jgi:hypothetical protein
MQGTVRKEPLDGTTNRARGMSMGGKKGTEWMWSVAGQETVTRPESGIRGPCVG